MIYSDFNLALYTNMALTVSIEPPTAAGGWNVDFRVQNVFGFASGPLILKSVNSGYNTVSGITVTNSGQGTIQINFIPGDTSGLVAKPYCYAINRYLSGGSYTLLAEGMILCRDNLQGIGVGSGGLYSG